LENGTLYRVYVKTSRGLFDPQAQRTGAKIEAQYDGQNVDRPITLYVRKLQALIHNYLYVSVRDARLYTARHAITDRNGLFLKMYCSEFDCKINTGR